MPHLQHAPATRLARRNQGAPWRGPTCPTYPTIKGGGSISPPCAHRARPAGLSAIFRDWLDWLGRLDKALKINELLRPTWSGARGRLAGLPTEEEHPCRSPMPTASKS